MSEATLGGRALRPAAAPSMKARLKRALIRRAPRLLPHLKSAQLTATLLGGAVLRRLPGSSRRFGPPRAVVRSLADYAAGADGRVRFAVLRPPEMISRRPPMALDGRLHPAFVAELQRLSPATGVAAIAEGRVLTRSGAVIAPEDCLIDDVSAGFLGDDPRGNEIFLRLKLPPVTRLDAAVAVLAAPASGNYFHWLFDTLPRLHLLEASGLPWERVVAPRQTAFQREALALLGLDEARIIDAPDRHIEASTLVVPSLPGVPGNPPGWACAFLRERLLPAGAAGGGERRIYVSRRQSGTRKVVNEEELFAALAADGFELFFLEDLAFRDQIALFRSARTVVSAHGSGLANLLFCPPGAGVVELFSPDYVNVCYWALANQLGLDYRYVLGWGRPKASPGAGTGLVHENITIDVAQVQAALRALG